MRDHISYLSIISVLDVFVTQACICVMCSRLRSDAVCSIYVYASSYDYPMLCSISSGLRSDAVSEIRSDAEGKALVSFRLWSDAVSGLRSDAEGMALVSSGLWSDAVSGLRSNAVGKAQ